MSMRAYIGNSKLSTENLEKLRKFTKTKHTINIFPETSW